MISLNTARTECLGIQQVKNAWGYNKKRMPGDAMRKECLGILEEKNAWGYSKNGIPGDI